MQDEEEYGAYRNPGDRRMTYRRSQQPSTLHALPTTDLGQRYTPNYKDQVGSVIGPPTGAFDSFVGTDGVVVCMYVHVARRKIDSIIVRSCSPPPPIWFLLFPSSRGHTRRRFRCSH